MIEKIVIGIIVLSAFIYIVRISVKAFKEKDQKKNCSGCCSNCHLFCTDEEEEDTNN